LVYTITAFNNGPSAATNVVLDATLPTTVTTDLAKTSVSQGSFTLAGNIFQALFGTIASGDTATATITVTPNSVGSITITSSINGDQIDADTSNNTASHSTTVNVPIDLSIQVSPNPNPVIANGTLTFTILVTNNINGPNAGSASGVVVTNTLPAGSTFLSASTGQGSFTQPVNGVMNLSLGTLAPGATVASTITVAVGPTTGIITNVATVSADETDTNPSNNTVSTDVEVKPSADLAVTMTASPNPVLVGNQLVYTITVNNSGPANASGVILTNTLPAGVTVDSIFPSQGNATQSGNLITADFGAILASGSATLTIVVRPTVSGTITNTASVASDDLDPNPTNNTASVSTSVSPADVGVTITAAPNPAVLGANLVYTIVVTNFGPAGATGVQLVNQLPPGVRFVSATSDQGTPFVNGSVVTTDIGSLAAGALVRVRVTVVPLSSTILTTTASVTSLEDDNNPANNTASLQTAVSPADLTVLAASAPTAVLVGDQLNFVVTVVNHGPAVASGVVLTNTLPPGAVFVSAVGPNFNAIGSPVGGVITATINTLAPGATATLVITVRPTAVGASVNTAHVVSTNLDPNPTDNTTTALANVTNQPGTLQFASSVFSVNEGAGTAIITVTRTAGNLGAVTIPYLAFGGTAVPGLDYTPTSGLLVFGDGETVKSFTVPIIDNTITQPDRSVILALGAPSGGATLGPLASATLIIHDNDPDLTGPTVTDIQLLGGIRVTGVVLSFSEPLNPVTASDPRNYALFATNQRLRGGGRGDVSVPIASVLYDPISNRVLLTPVRPLQANQLYRVVANAGPGGLTDLAGNPLDGDANGVNGTNLVRTFARGTNLVYGDSNGDAVNLRLSGGGFLSLVRAANGDAQVVSILGNARRHSTISGSVRPSRTGGDGVTTIGRIDGLEPFGRIRSTLRTPPFIVGNQPLFAPSLIRPAAVDALLASGDLVNRNQPLNRGHR
ncbi:MAG: Calx-beta domain-containing protein, partial [Isosphaeraceae bacterium]